MNKFPPLDERPCWSDPGHSCHLPPERCVCRQETEERIQFYKTKLLWGVCGALTGLFLWRVWWAS